MRRCDDATAKSRRVPRAGTLRYPLPNARPNPKGRIHHDKMRRDVCATRVNGSSQGPAKKRRVPFFIRRGRVMTTKAVSRFIPSSVPSQAVSPARGAVRTTQGRRRRAALECGGLTPPCGFKIHTEQRAIAGRFAGQGGGTNYAGKAASSRRTPRCLRHCAENRQGLS
jgi:hypothetical protein